MKRGLPGAAVRVLLGTLTVLVGLCVAAPAAHADEPQAYVSVSIDTMTPALPTRDGTVRLRGTITNISTAELTNLQAAFWRSLDPISDAEGMQRALASAANDPLGRRVRPETLYQNLPSERDRTLAPGRSAKFDLTVDVADLELPKADAVYLVGVHIRGRTDPLGPDITVGRGRIFLPLVTRSPANSLRLTSLVVLTSRPSWVRSGVLADDHLAGEVAPGGRLRTLLAAANQQNVSFAVDPALVEELETMRNGYQVLGTDGESTSAGAGQSDAGKWLDDFARLRRGGDGFRLLYANPDIAALVHDQQASVLELAAQAGDAVSGTHGLPLLILPGSGRADAETVSAAQALRPKAIVLSDSSARGPGPLLTGLGPARILSYTATAFGGGPGPEPRDTPVKLRQRVLADTWLQASTADAGSTIGRLRLITSASQAQGAGPHVDTPWMRTAALSDLLAGTPSTWNERLRYPASARDAELGPAQRGDVRRLTADYGTATDLLVEPTALEAEARRVLPRAASIAWRTEPEAAASYSSAVQRRLTDFLRDEVTISVIPRVQTTGRSANFPITVRNGLPAPGSGDDPDHNAVAVTLRFESANSQRLTVAPISLPSVPADDRVTDNAQVQAQTNGTVRVRAQLYTKSGRRIGKAVVIQVSATQAGTTGWFIALAAGVVLVGTTALRIRQVARERSASGAVEPVVVSRSPEDGEAPGSADADPDDGRSPAPAPGGSRETLDV